MWPPSHRRDSKLYPCWVRRLERLSSSCSAVAGRPAAQYQETPIPLSRATLHASAPAVSGSVDMSAQFRRRQSRRPVRAWRRSSDRDCKLIGPNPFLTPFNVFGPLTLCLSIGVHFRRQHHQWERIRRFRPVCEIGRRRTEQSRRPLSARRDFQPRPERSGLD